MTPTTVSAADSKEKQDLLDLFGKYDLEHKPGSQSGEIDEDVDLIEEKMKQFQVNADATTGDNASVQADAVLVEETTLEKPHQSSSVVEGDPIEVPEQSDQNVEAKSESATASSQIDSMSIQPYIIPLEDDFETKPAEVARSESVESDKGKADQQEGGDLLDMETTGPAEEFLDSGPAAVDSAAVPLVRPQQHRKNSIVRAGEAVNPQERYQQSHKPFDFQIFLNHLKKKSADPIVRYIRSFLVTFSRQASSMSTRQTILAIRQFKEFLNDKFHIYEPFASMDSVDLENSNEGVEKLIMNRLYDYCFSPEAVKKFGPTASTSVLEDVKQDEAFLLQVEKFSWILGIHLDVDLDDIARRKQESSKDSLDYLDYAIAQLNKMNSYRAPRDKIICILNACKIIFNLLKVSNQETNADAFIPLLILVIIRAKTPNLISNLHYIERYRGEEWLNHGETSYYLSSIQGAITFVLNIKKEDLTVSESEFDANMESWEAELKQRNPSLLQPISVPGGTEQTTLDVPRTTTMSPSEVLFASAGMFTKSISNFISPSPQGLSPPPEQQLVPGPAGDTSAQPEISDEQIDLAFGQLTEIFPTLDKAILRDVIIMNEADVERSLEVCLSLVNEN